MVARDGDTLYGVVVWLICVGDVGRADVCGATGCFWLETLGERIGRVADQPAARIPERSGPLCPSILMT